MFHHLLKPLAGELSGRRAWLDTSHLWQFRNTVCTPALREACRFCVRRCRENGVRQARLVPYVADGVTACAGAVLPPEWEAREATLSVVRPAPAARRLTSLAENALALMSRSGPTRRGGVEAELVVLNDGTRPEHYRGLNVRGRIVMTSRQGGAVAALARERGAIGIVSDTTDRPAMPGYEAPLREPFDAPDAVQWNCLPGMGPTRDLFGFVLSPRQGRRLRDLAAASPRPVMLRADVDARLFKGHSDVVDAVVPGSGNEELWVLAHISEPGAYDNASGVALSMEIARTLRAVVAAGALPPLRRSVRFLFSTEVSGYLPYLDQYRERLPRVVAGLCLDSVGVALGRVGSEFCIFRSPDYAPSYIEDLLGEVAEAMAHLRADWFGDDNYSLMPYRFEPFWGNDAFITDPYFNVPTAELSCWPFRYYHTSDDQPQYLSPDNLARSGVLCATFLYFLANAGEREAAWLASLTAAKARTRLADTLRNEAWAQAAGWRGRPTAAKLNASLLKVGQCRRYHEAVECERIGQPLRLATGAGPRAAVAGLVAATQASAAGDEQALAGVISGLAGRKRPGAVATAAAPAPSPALVRRAQAMVPVRKSWRLPAEGKYPARVRRQLAAVRERGTAAGVNLSSVWPWFDGRRDVHSLWERLQYRVPCPLDLLVDWVSALVRAGAVDLR